MENVSMNGEVPSSRLPLGPAYRISWENIGHGLRNRPPTLLICDCDIAYRILEVDKCYESSLGRAQLRCDTLYIAIVEGSSVSKTTPTVISIVIVIGFRMRYVINYI